MHLNDKIGDCRGTEWPQARFFLSAFTLIPTQHTVIQSKGTTLCYDQLAVKWPREVKCLAPGHTANKCY